ncbi:hypothetical protein B0H14DRAFT_3159439 [Mycena olivaceomarginata]|nr:hypothetical protein B0H14DRAFT_3159439 [Mycena olivaceomarginata]
MIELQIGRKDEIRGGVTSTKTNKQRLAPGHGGSEYPGQLRRPKDRKPQPRDKGTAGRRTSLRVYTCTTSLHTVRPFLATRLPVYPPSPASATKTSVGQRRKRSRACKWCEGRLGVRERTGSEIGRGAAEDRERLPPRARAMRTRGHRTRKRGEGREPSTERMVHVDPPASIVNMHASIRASLEYVDEWLSEPPDSELLEPGGWTSVEGILNVVERRLRPVTQLEGGGSQSAAPPYVTYHTSMGCWWRLAGQGAAASCECVEWGGGGREAVVLSDMFRNIAEDGSERKLT